MKNVPAIVAGLYLAAIAGAAYLLYRNRDKFNPASDKNLAYQAGTSIVKIVTGDPNQTPGGLIFDLLNPNAGLAPGETFSGDGIRVQAKTAPTATPGTAPAVDPYLYYPLGVMGGGA